MKLGCNKVMEESLHKEVSGQMCCLQFWTSQIDQSPNVAQHVANPGVNFPAGG